AQVVHPKHEARVGFVDGVRTRRHRRRRWGRPGRGGRRLVRRKADSCTQYERRKGASSQKAVHRASPHLWPFWPWLPQGRLTLRGADSATRVFTENRKAIFPKSLRSSPVDQRCLRS